MVRKAVMQQCSPWPCCAAQALQQQGPGLQVVLYQVVPATLSVHAEAHCLVYLHTFAPQKALDLISAQLLPNQGEETGQPLMRPSVQCPSCG